MLTGDKLETAKCIAISTGIKSHKESVFEMRDLLDNSDIIDAI
jgi:magnesium-transporting ATPase (P-type)